MYLVISDKPQINGDKIIDKKEDKVKGIVIYMEAYCEIK